MSRQVKEPLDPLYDIPIEEAAIGATRILWDNKKGTREGPARECPLDRRQAEALLERMIIPPEQWESAIDRMQIELRLQWSKLHERESES